MDELLGSARRREVLLQLPERALGVLRISQRSARDVQNLSDADAEALCKLFVTADLDVRSHYAWNRAPQFLARAWCEAKSADEKRRNRAATAKQSKHSTNDFVSSSSTPKRRQTLMKRCQRCHPRPPRRRDLRCLPLHKRVWSQMHPAARFCPNFERR